MRQDQFTVKAQEAIAAAQTAAERQDHPEVTPEHLLGALIAQEGGVVGAILAKMGADRAALESEIGRALASLPHTQGAATSISGKLDGVFKSALREAEALMDEYTSTEHLLLALLDAKGTPAAQALKAQKITRDSALKVLREVRGAHRVDDPHAE